MQMSRLRNTENSIYYALYEALSDSYIKDKGTTTDNITFQFSEDSWLWSKPVIVYNNGEPIDTGFRINYEKGQVIFDNPLTPGTVVEADYHYCFVNLYPDYPVSTDTEQIPIELPAVAIEHVHTDSVGGELGSQLARVIRRRFEITVWAQRAGQRNDIAEIIENRLWRGIILIDFSKGYPFLPDGSKNPNYDPTKQAIGVLQFVNVLLRPFRAYDFGDVQLHQMIIEAFCEDSLF